MALSGYSAVFMRYALAVTPKNYLLFGCHIVNFSAQATQGYRFVNYWYMGGRDEAMQQKAKEGLEGAEKKVEDAGSQVKHEAEKFTQGATTELKQLKGKAG